MSRFCSKSITGNVASTAILERIRRTYSQALGASRAGHSSISALPSTWVSRILEHSLQCLRMGKVSRVARPSCASRVTLLGLIVGLRVMEGIFCVTGCRIEMRENIYP